MHPFRRRTLLALGMWGAVGSLAAACGAPPARAADRRSTYGDDASQYADLYLPSGTPRGVVVVVHGGYWMSGYDATLGAPLAASLAGEGWAAWNLGYRRVGNGGGVPATLDDVAAGIDALAETGLDLTTVLALGHSAGGQLAAWSAARARFDRWSPVRVPVTGVLSQAGVLDLRAGVDEGLGGGAVTAFVGGPPGADVDPSQQLPLDVPVRCVHGRSDSIVPLSQSADYVEAARAAGADASLTEVDGDHFAIIDPTTPAWATQLELLAELSG